MVLPLTAFDGCRDTTTRRSSFIIKVNGVCLRSPHPAQPNAAYRTSQRFSSRCGCGSPTYRSHESAGSVTVGTTVAPIWSKIVSFAC